VLFAVAGVPAGAQIQAEAELHVPYGMDAQSLGKDGEGTGELLESLGPVPDLRLQYYFGPEWISWGPGVRMFSTIIDTLIYPTVSAETRAGRFVFNLNVGGGAFIFLGGHNAVSFEPVVLPELTTTYMIWDVAGVGAGLFFVLDPTDTLELGGITGGVAYVPTLFCRFVFGQDKASKNKE
jgi:hypothetical protein